MTSVDRGLSSPGTRPGIDRREAIRRAAMLAGIALSPGLVTFVVGAQTAGATSPAAKTYLTPVQAAVASAAAERILPRTDTPGAIDAGVPAFLDRFYGEFMTDAERQLFVAGLDAIEAAARTAHSAAFASLTSARQDTVLRSVAAAQQNQNPSSFGLLRSLTILGYFSSEQATKVLNYEPVPGGFEPCIPLDQVRGRDWFV